MFAKGYTNIRAMIEPQNLKSATCKLLFIITPIMLTKDVLLYLGEKRLVG